MCDQTLLILLRKAVDALTCEVVAVRELLQASLNAAGDPLPALPTNFARVLGPSASAVGPVSRLGLGGLRVLHHYVDAEHVLTRTIDVYAVQAVEYMSEAEWCAYANDLAASAARRAAVFGATS